MLVEEPLLPPMLEPDEPPMLPLEPEEPPMLPPLAPDEPPMLLPLEPDEPPMAPLEPEPLVPEVPEEPDDPPVDESLLPELDDFDLSFLALVLSSVEDDDEGIELDEDEDGVALEPELPELMPELPELGLEDEDCASETPARVMSDRNRAIETFFMNNLRLKNKKSLSRTFMDATDLRSDWAFSFRFQ